ncbi:sensor histidine kinase [Undibacterium crateris]|uniref:sensor histidine kinase n=1 Tax=Undibacterium crateris TaxID=2528175 RepID=UPI00138A6108|nr:ATP-binding protein [Undibacterium crateris]NDI85544.1 hypothetical protein [Undibacterium crateris]
MPQVAEHEAGSDWFRNGIHQLRKTMNAEYDQAKLAQASIQQLASYVDAELGLILFTPATHSKPAVYTYPPEQQSADGSTALLSMSNESVRLKKTLIQSGEANDAPAVSSIAIPLIWNAHIHGAISLVAAHAYTPQQVQWLEEAAGIVSIAIDSFRAHQHNRDLLQQIQTQAEEIASHQQALLAANARLAEQTSLPEQTRLLKAEFLSNMSHDLRTPFNSILTLSQLLQLNRDGSLSARQVEYAATINTSGKSLLSLIENILDLSKIEAGAVEFNYHDVDTEKFVADIQHQFQSLAQSKNMNFDLNLASNVPAVLNVDLARTQQIIRHLLNNAFKFNSEGKVSLAILRSEAEQNPLAVPALHFAVSDSGTGMTAELSEQISQALTNTDWSTTRPYGGTGLGLSISRQLAQRMYGCIQHYSAPESGSVFSLFLPLRKE